MAGTARPTLLADGQFEKSKIKDKKVKLRYPPYGGWRFFYLRRNVQF